MWTVPSDIMAEQNNDSLRRDMVTRHITYSNLFNSQTSQARPTDPPLGAAYLLPSGAHHEGLGRGVFISSPHNHQRKK